MTGLSTQIVIDDSLMEYELPGHSAHDGSLLKKARMEPSPKNSFKVIHDLERPRSQSLCLVQMPARFARPVEAVTQSPLVESQWRLEKSLN